MPGFPVNHQLPKLAQTHVHPVDDAIQPSHSLLSPSLTAFNLIQHQGSFQMSQFFTLGGQSTRVSASNECLSNEYSGLISLRTDWFNHLAVQGTLTCPQFKSINSLALSFLHSPTLTSMHYYWKNLNFD